ncbi:hypothetical protein HII36_31165 [Nonomuraea sp. NN258]|uniref:hypothetical protein n=1 Tax=Nonomuraea antri TaxID=2730852 RepID=UPI0015687036|nr:hypothetical protein [Nonomuraea antri]NRQ36261.1 hypothetical protein [Nonomuraea antri]
MMETASSDEVDLERQVRQALTDAGFAVEPSMAAEEGGLSVWHDPGRGVVVMWGTSAELSAKDRVKYRNIRTAVRLALRTILAEAGYHVREDFDGLELIVTL